VPRYLHIFSYLLLLLFSTAGFAQTPQSSARDVDKAFHIPKLIAEVDIDGLLDEAVWSQAALVDDLHQIDPLEYAEPSQRTEIRLFYTKDALYIGAKMLEADGGPITAQVLKQGASIGADDYFGFSIDPYLDKRNGYAFRLNPNGVRWDALYKNITEFVEDWDGIWLGETSRDENGWTVEISIPFQTLSFNPDTSTWGINFERKIARNNEWLGWVTRERQLNPSVSGTATGIENIRQGRGLDIVPSMTARKEREFGALPVASDSSEDFFEPSLDVFFKITPQLNAALTINTDFSAADVDSRQVNLSRFNLFFPEKRDFFLRDADIFDFGSIGSGSNPAVPGGARQNARPFFSRTIGLNQVGSPVDINYGGKISGRINNFNVGGLVIRQDQDDSSGVDSQDVFVGRATVNVLSESSVGVILTDGDPQSNLDNTLIGSDFNYRNSNLANDRIITAHAWYQQTETEGLTGNDSAYGLGIAAPNTDRWLGELAVKKVESNFDPAVGFINRTGIQDLTFNVGYRHRFQAGDFLRFMYAGFDSYSAETLDDGKLNSQIIGLRLTGDKPSGDRAFSRLIRSREVLRESFTIYKASDGSQLVTIPHGNYTFSEFILGFTTAGYRVISGGGRIQGGDYYDGKHLSTSFDINWIPNRYFNASIRYFQDDIELPYGDFVVRLMSIKGDIAFSSRWSWSNLIQYDDVSEKIGFNSRLHWIPQAGREVFIVFNYGMADRDKDNDFRSTNADLALKFSYTFRY
jgi:hypothetical protein